MGEIGEDFVPLSNRNTIGTILVLLCVRTM